MESLDIKSGNADIIASGTVMSFEGNPIEIEFGEPKNRLKLINVFQDEKGKGDLRVEAINIDDNTLKITFFNFKNPHGSGNTKPLSFGTYEGRRLYINYRIFDLNPNENIDKTLHYTIYLGEEVPKNDKEL